MTQKEAIARHLAEEKHITSFEAFTNYGVTRLSSIIFDLRRDGMDIVTRTKTTVNRYGHRTQFADYWLKGGMA